jgi:hypothetical protein
MILDNEQQRRKISNNTQLRSQFVSTLREKFANKTATEDEKYILWKYF